MDLWMYGFMWGFYLVVQDDKPLRRSRSPKIRPRCLKCIFLALSSHHPFQVIFRPCIAVMDIIFHLLDLRYFSKMNFILHTSVGVRRKYCFRLKQINPMTFFIFLCSTIFLELHRHFWKSSQ